MGRSEMEWFQMFFSRRQRLSEEALNSGAAMVQSLLEKGESGSALALLEVHPMSTMDPETQRTLIDILHTSTYREKRRGDSVTGTFLHLMCVFG